MAVPMSIIHVHLELPPFPTNSYGAFVKGCWTEELFPYIFIVCRGCRENALAILQAPNWQGTVVGRKLYPVWHGSLPFWGTCSCSPAWPQRMSPRMTVNFWSSSLNLLHVPPCLDYGVHGLRLVLSASRASRYQRSIHPQSHGSPYFWSGSLQTSSCMKQQHDSFGWASCNREFWCKGVLKWFNHAVSHLRSAWKSGVWFLSL